jgi:DNA repair protein RecN (Recombination protein N)
MIKRLSIRNLILIDKADISFGQGLNIITGETGSGKSAILSALRLILGERADLQMIGKHSDLAVVEAEVAPLGISSHVRREIHRSGKSRSFVNDELVSLTELRALFTDFLELADQGAAYKLFVPEEQRLLLDAFGKIDLTEFTKAFHETQKKRLALDELRRLAEEIRLEEDRLQNQLAFLDKVNWQSGEEETLMKTHASLAKAEKSAEKLSALSDFLSEGQSPILPPLKRFAGQMEALELPEMTVWLQSARANLEEASLFLSSYLADLDFSRDQLLKIEERIGEIEQIKRKYAKTQPEAQKIRDTVRERLAHLDKIDEEIKVAQTSYAASEGHLLSLEGKLTAERLIAAADVTKAVLAELHDLNIQGARLEIQIHRKNRSPTGADDIQWFFSANPGEPLLPLNQTASGGELSRLLLAIKIALKEKKCLILDEIDGNVGGHTAALLGRKLQELSGVCQIICVTHFVQVAKCACHHFLVSKQQNEKGSVTHLQKLDETMRMVEYARMIGGQN